MPRIRSSATSLPDGAGTWSILTSISAVRSAASRTPSSAAAGDSDDDGVVFQGGNYVISPATGTSIKSIVVTASVAGVLDGWIDWNGNGVWDASEEVTWTDAGGTPWPHPRWPTAG